MPTDELYEVPTAPAPKVTPASPPSIFDRPEEQSVVQKSRTVENPSPKVNSSTFSLLNSPKITKIPNKIN